MEAHKMMNISRLVALLLALMLCLTAVFAIAEETEHGNETDQGSAVQILGGVQDSTPVDEGLDVSAQPVAGGYTGKELNADVNAYNQMAQSAATVALLEELMGAPSVEEMYALVLTIVNGEDAARYDILMALSFDQLEQLRFRVNELDPELDDVDTQDMLDMLSAMPNAQCPDCGLIGEHEEDCPRYQVEVLLPGGYIYFDLSRGSVTFSIDGTYTGYLNGKTIKGSHSNDNQYYIFQGDGSTNYTTALPVYSNVTYQGMDWGDFVTNHPSKSNAGDDSVDELIAAWEAADKGTRKATANKITFQTVTSNTTFNVTIDNLWSTHQGRGSSEDAALSFQAIGNTILNESNEDTYTDAATNVTVNLTVKGDNRLSRLHCATHDGQNNNYRSDKGHTNTINFSGDEDATLTLANMQQNLTGSNGAYTAGLIGGTDRCDHSFKMNFKDITVYAGGGRLDFGCAIGGGGNGPGRISISSGRITAVNSSTGAAIGGGCGTSGPGGYGNVSISGGNVYAYNYKPHFTSENDTSYTDAMPTAIGGGSSGLQIGGTGIVKISGGYVYAYSEVGNAIGGGGGGNGQNNSYDNGEYTHTYGGTADVTISGDAKVEAVSGKGCAIGGGPGGGRKYEEYAQANNGTLPTAGAGSGTMGITVNGDGGTAKLTITGNPTIISGSIGGGSPLEENRKYGATVGAAVVGISGGKIYGQVVMDGVIKNVPSGIDLTEGALSSFTMTGGVINNAARDSKYIFVEKNGGAVYINSGSAKMTGGEIKNASSPLGGAIYLQGGDFELSGTGTIQNCSATEFGGAVYIKGGDATVSGGKIENCFASKGGAAYVADGSLTMSGGTMINNGKNAEGTVITTHGGAAYVTGGKFSMTGGSLESNIAANDGGAVYVDGGQVTIGKENCIGDSHSHPVLSKNEAINGGAVAVANSSPIMHCGTMIGNEAVTNGGAVYVSEGSFTMNGGSIGSEGNANTAVNGGAVYVSGGSFTMNNGAISNNKAPLGKGGAVYVTTTGTNEANFRMEHGFVNNNFAINGGAVYVNGGSFIMKSGNMTGNEAKYSSLASAEAGAEGYGGAVYVTGGNAEIGVQNCYQETPCSEHVEHGSKWHPVMTENKAAFGGAVAVKGGNVTFYCCDIADNEALSRGTGQNVFMGAGEEDEGKITYHYDGANIGVSTDHGMVSIGGDLTIIQKNDSTLKVYLKYNPNFGTELEWKGEAPDDFYLNLPYCPEEWQEAQREENLTFVGWTEEETDAGDVRKKPDYHDIGYPVYLDEKSAEHDEKTDTYTLNFWAVWAPKENVISYAYTLNDTDDSEIKFNPKVGFIPEGAPTKYEYSMGASSVPIGECTLQGYRFLGWRLYADKVDADNKPMNVNWHADPNTYEDDWTPPEQLGNLPKYDDYRGNYNGTGEPPTHIDENSYLVNNELNLNANFGNITLVAVFEPAYSGLKIVKEVKDGDAVDQQFIFSIVGKTDLSEDVNLQIVIAGEGSAFIHLPVGNYTVTELENWSWRYDVTNVKEDTFEMPMARTMLAASEVQPYCEIEIHDPEEGVELTFTNDRVNTQWLDASAIYQNELK